MLERPRATDLLIAPPGIPDPRFEKTVLLLSHDHRGGAFALCLNKITDHTVQDVTRELELEMNINFPMYWGGPVSPGTIWMLHSSEWECEHTVPIAEGWSMTSNEQMFYHLADGDCPRHFRLTFGYCSWAPGQLRAELEGQHPWKQNNSWLIAKNPGAEWLFEHAEEDLWTSATALCGQQAVASWL
jgi:putative transcriptional regulator